MSCYNLNKQEKKELNKIIKTYYIQPTLSRIDKFVDSSKDKKEVWKLVFNELFNIITNAHKEVDLILDERIKRGEITNKQQASKTVVGNTFPFAVIYIFLHNKIIGNIKDNIYITSELSKINGFEDVATIKIGEETQKPDCDLVIYSVSDDNKLANCLILSLKTSLRERAAQTYKWKLLMEIAISDDCSVKDKYDIVYNAKILPKICFATINFYNEINNPQQRGMLKFFDKSFIAKNVNQNLPTFISPMSNLIDFVNDVF
ncbi:BsaWI family type II restriction enzyme [Cyanobacterium sp. DS4]|uniref:BsaWI family type II restriction enzyme n=1 Tax=Cyanobacterium sp. DS4 TaxID=2878255 RepID=UPI002E822662|nr:BsaWI family type II restriction enzyme [Cyanobacterium sp. Dongsha4]WVL01220.1 BsaWI family type II restriction enzyme [Cyanobacterium sp. Dongsha4]